VPTDQNGLCHFAEHFPDKPKGLHWRTYERLHDEAAEAELRSWVGMAQPFVFCWLRYGTEAPS